MVRVPMAGLPEHVIEAITGEKLRQDGVQTKLLALFMSGGVPKGRLDLQRLAKAKLCSPGD